MKGGGDKNRYATSYITGGDGLVYAINMAYPKEIMEDKLKERIELGVRPEGQDHIAWMVRNKIPLVVATNPRTIKDPISWAVDNGIGIDGKNPVVWAIDNEARIEGKAPIEWAIENKKTIENTDPIKWAIINDKKINNRSAVIWAIINDKPIEGKPSMEWVSTQEEPQKKFKIRMLAGDAVKLAIKEGKMIAGKEPVICAIENDIKIGSKDPIYWLLRENFGNRLRNDQRNPTIDGIDAIKWAVENGTMIERMNPIRWAVENGTMIDGMNPIRWAADYRYNIEGKDPLIWAVHDGHNIEGKDPLIWAIEQEKKIEGKDPIIWAIENGIEIRYEPALIWAVSNNMVINKQDPVEWALANNHNIPEILLIFNKIINDEVIADKDNEIFIKNNEKIQGKTLIEWAIEKNKSIEGKEPLQWAAEKGLKINGKDATVWAIEKNKSIEGKEPLQWAVENDVKIEQKDAIAWAIGKPKKIEANKYLANLAEIAVLRAVENDAKIGGQDPIDWALSNFIWLEDKNPIAWAAENRKQINNKNPIVWVVDNKKMVENKDPIRWAVENGVKIEEQDALEWAIEKIQRIESMDPMEWGKEFKVEKGKEEALKNAIRKGNNVDGKNAIVWAMENDQIIAGKEPILFALKDLGNSPRYYDKSIIELCAAKGHDLLLKIAEEYSSVKAAKREEDKEYLTKLSELHKIIVREESINQSAPNIIDKDSALGQMLLSNNPKTIARLIEKETAGFKETEGMTLSYEHIMEHCNLELIDKISEVGEALSKRQDGVMQSIADKINAFANKAKILLGIGRGIKDEELAAAVKDLDVIAKRDVNLSSGGIKNESMTEQKVKSFVDKVSSSSGRINSEKRENLSQVSKLDNSSVSTGHCL
ncbi:hypothetical protein I862_00080 [endosymbiont of Acanthamoeba sp. UWC8]|uniref:hypothetical protein n=1 Tax=endosymbiont of Acanthamoeba sp. UWC8 TaxID=86106 RepID=UPI0004D18299|nr:hypothetical protein [endosymbiont of Acanthamoeba sp. UWC8]AIF80581.1 hypothetical protein I862_00080 [endosymbiont of Acanthamoeba sp. UWC8]